MRKLTEQELKLVQKAITAKEISVVEILAEVYDHYISHLEGFPEEEFKSELAILESKWTYPYCQSLQNDFSKSINKSITSLQWKLIKSYFTWPKILSTVILFGFFYALSVLLTPKVFFSSTIIPILIIVHVFNFYLMFSSRKRYKELRSIFNFKTTGLFIQSAESSSLNATVGSPLSVLNLLFFIPRIFDLDLGVSLKTLLFIMVFIAFLISIISFSAYQAWKIKTKTALI